MSDIHNQKASEIIKKIIYITLSTVSKDGQPWNSPLYSAFDKDLNFYWASDKEGVHSKNVRSNNKVYVVIYDSTMPEGTGEGVYILGKAYEIPDKDEIMVARLSMQNRKGKDIGHDEYVKFTGDNIRRIYKFVPETIWMNDDEKDENGQYIKDIRIEVPIEELKKFI